MQGTDTQVNRKETGMRILLSALFIVIAEVVRAILAVIILFELIFTLITQRLPSERVRGFANRTLSYLYHVLRYLTYNAAEPPFPFADFPPELEPGTPMHKAGTGEGERQGANPEP
jgi:hypothetical protein